MKALLKKYKVILPDRLSQVLIDGKKREEPTISSTMIRFPGTALYVDTIEELTEKIKSRCETQADFYHTRNLRNLGKKCKIMQVLSMQVFVLENILVFITLKKLVILIFFREPDLIS